MKKFTDEHKKLMLRIIQKMESKTPIELAYLLGKIEGSPEALNFYRPFVGQQNGLDLKTRCLNE